MGIDKFYTHDTMIIVSKHTLKFIVLLVFLGAYLLCCLILFYHHWNMAWDSLRQCFKRFMPSMNKKIHGLYPLSMISGTEHNLMKTAHMTQHPLSIFDAAYMGIDKILPK